MKMPLDTFTEHLILKTLTCNSVPQDLCEQNFALRDTSFLLQFANKLIATASERLLPIP